MVNRGMVKTVTIGNNPNVYCLVRNAGSRKSNINRRISEFNGSLTHSQERRLERWT